MCRSMAWKDGLVRRKGWKKPDIVWRSTGSKRRYRGKVVVSIVVFLVWIFVVYYIKNVDGISLFGDSLPIGKRRGEER